VAGGAAWAGEAGAGEAGAAAAGCSSGSDSAGTCSDCCAIGFVSSCAGWGVSDEQATNNTEIKQYESNVTDLIARDLLVLLGNAGLAAISAVLMIRGEWISLQFSNIHYKVFTSSRR